MMKLLILAAVVAVAAVTYWRSRRPSRLPQEHVDAEFRRMVAALRRMDA